MNRKAKTFPGAASIYLESDFYVKADILRDQFEAQILGAADQNGGITSFSHAFCRDAFQFLTASAQSIFSADILDDVIGKLGSWATETLGTTSMSTPQTRLYIQGCSRDLLQDGIGEKWHYMLSICRNRKNSAGHIKLLCLIRRKTEFSDPSGLAGSQKFDWVSINYWSIVPELHTVLSHRKSQ